MAKRYYQGKKDKMDESYGMKSYEGSMISADMSAPSHMPQKVMIKDYPQNPYMGHSSYPDTLKDADYITGKAIYSKDVKKSWMD